MDVKRVLEFDKILDSIADNAILECTQEKILTLIPLMDKVAIEHRLTIVRELKECFQFDEGLNINEIIDIKRAILPKLAMIGNILNEAELYLLKETIKTFREAKNKILSLEEKYPALFKLYHNAPTYKPLEELIVKVVDDNREIKPTASLELASNVEQQKLLKIQIKRKLEQLMSEKSYEHALQEKLITIRNERFVIPIKSTHKGHVKGIEHDRSESSLTVFIEPLAVVALNNRLRELITREKEEKRKILIRITDQLRIHTEGLEMVANGLSDLDFFISLALFMKKNHGEVPIISHSRTLALYEAKHPLLSQASVVAVDVSIEREKPLFLITGPNTGGKTVLLKTIGLLSMMALTGIAIPAKGKSQIPIYDGIYSDIGDEQSIEQSLSSFSGHLKNVQEIFEIATDKSLILLDELCSGTDPVEGAALAMAMVEHIEKIGSQAVITTHYSEVKSFAFNHAKIETASMEFDINTLSPTYRLLIGIPGESNAINISKKLKLNPSIIESAKRFLSEESKKVEVLIQEITEKSKQLDDDKRMLEAERITLKAKTQILEEKMLTLEQEKLDIEAKANENAEKLIIQAQDKAKAIVAKIQNSDTTREQMKADQKSLNMLRTAILDSKQKQKEKQKTLDKAQNRVQKIEVSVGEIIYSKSLKKDAKVINPDYKGQVLVQAGILKLALSYSDIEKITQKKAKIMVRPKTEKSRTAHRKIDLRGKLVDEAIDDLDHELDTALLNGIGEVEIIHGKGTGALRDGVQKYLKESIYIADYRDGRPNEGGFGVTIATLK